MSRDLGELKYSSVTSEFPDKSKYPLFYQANKHEITIRAGEKLFIPAGWFHFVFSEETDEESGLNVALNFWFFPLNNWKPGDPSSMLPHKKKHDLNPSMKDIFGNQKLRCTYSDLNGFFPSDRIFHRFPEGKLCHHYLTFNEFYESKNHKMYIIQHGDINLEKYAPDYPNGIYMSSAWANFGKACSAIHYDEHDNWLYQLKGSKRVILFPHEDRHLMYLFNNLDSTKVTNTIIKMSNTITHFILKKRVGILPQKEETSDFFKNQIQNYVNTRQDVNIPLFDMPSNYKIHHTNGLNWHWDDCKLPLVFMLVVSGKGSIIFVSKNEYELDPGDVIIFPNHFTYPYQTTGNLKILIPE